MTAVEPAQHFASAELFFGIAWDPEYLDARTQDRQPSVLGQAAGEEEGAWWKTLLLGKGHVDPWLTAPQEDGYGSEDDYIDAHRTWRTDTEQEIDAWRRAARAIQDEYQVDVGWHGSTLGGGTRYPHLFVVTSVHSADQWEAKHISLETLAASDDWAPRLQRFVTDLQVDVASAVGPCWLLTANLA